MLIVLTEMYEGAPEVSTYLVETDRLPLDLKKIVETDNHGYSGEYVASAKYNDAWKDAFTSARVKFPYTGTIYRAVLFWWR